MKTSTFSNESVLLSHENYDISELYETKFKPALATQSSKLEVKVSSHAPLPTHQVIVTYEESCIQQSIACKTTKAAWQFIQENGSGADAYTIYGPKGYMEYRTCSDRPSKMIEYNDITYAMYLDYAEEFRFLDSHEMVIQYEADGQTKFTIKYGMQAATNFVADKGECFINTPEGYYCYGFGSVSQYQLFTYDQDDYNYDQLCHLAK